MTESRYTVISADDFTTAETANISRNCWNYKDPPRTEAKIIAKDGSLKIEMTCYEKSPLTRYTKNYDPVYLDSCMECFFNFAPEKTNRYMNIEANSSGAMICCIGEGREGRISVLEKYGMLPIVKIEKEDKLWKSTVTVSANLIKAVFDTELSSGASFIGNLYKCEQDSDTPNFLSWSPIESAKPDFHRPEFFGTFNIV